MNLDVAQSNYLFKLGTNQFAAGEFPDAIKTLRKASSQLLKEKDYKQYIQCKNILIIIHTEMENFDHINRIRRELAEVIWNHKQLGANYARFHYSLGFCFLREKDYIKAQVQFDQALAQALKLKTQATEEKDQKKSLISEIDTCYISYAFSCLYILNNKILEALEELKNMAMLIERLKSFPENQTADPNKRSKDVLAALEQVKDEIQTIEFLYNLLKAYILKTEKKYKSAEELYWLCYEQSRKTYRRKYMSIHLLHLLGENYMKKGDYEQASIFLNLVKKSANPQVLKKTYRKVIISLEKLKETMTNNYDMVVNFENKMIVEKEKGHINIKNQFILLDLLKLFVSNPGVVYSKESLVEKVWKQKYDPRVHDNKIYVTIKRLRELVEPDHKKPKYIFRTKEGYYINKKLKVSFK